MRTIAAFATAVGLLLFGTGFAVGGTVAPLPSAPRVSPDVASVTRGTFGLDTRSATIARLLADPTSDYTYGAPMTRREVADLHLREALRARAEALVKFIDDRPDEFGGLYFDQGAGRLDLTVLTTASTPGASKAALRRLAPQGLSIAERVVGRSFQALLDAQGAVQIAGPSLGMREVYPDVKANRLSVVIAPGSSAAAVESVAGMPVDVTFGEGLVPTACTTRTACTPYRGGTKIETPSRFCTWGFYGTHGTAAKYVLTAGHCGLLGNSIKHNGTTISTAAGVSRNTFDLGGTRNSDTMLAQVQGSANAIAPFNRIFVNGADTNHAITSVHASSGAVGDSVCFTGWATNTNLCGVIEAKPLTATYTREQDGKSLTLINQIRMNWSTLAGDSGGPVYLGAVAYGMVTAADSAHSNHMVYAHIGGISLDMGAICTTSAC